MERAPRADAASPARHTQPATVGDARDLDVDDLNYLMSSPESNVFEYHPRYGVRSPAVGLLRFGYRMGATLLRERRSARPASDSPEVLFAIETLNQYEAVRPILAHVERHLVLGLLEPFERPFPEGSAHLRSLRYLPALLRRARDPRGWSREGFRRALHLYWLTYGYYLTAVRELQALRPRLVVVSNDHGMRPRTFARAARDTGIPVAYVQHASVTDKFPPLSFDISFLDGMDAAEKYAAVGTTSGKAYLVGIAKADAVRQRRRPKGPIRRLGVCVNLVDPLPQVVRTLREVAAALPEVEVLLRPHPSDSRPWRSSVAVEVSDGRAERSFEFLGRVDAIVSGPSNIILEAALARVPAIFLDFAGRGGDGYGFVDAGLCPVATDAADVRNLVLGLGALRPSLERALRRFHATSGSAYDGRSAELVGALIGSFLTGGGEPVRWRRVPGFGSFEVLELEG